MLVATTIASVAGVFKDKWFNKSRAPQPTIPAPGTDALVMSAAIADSVAIANLAAGITRLVDFLEQDREDSERRDRALRLCLQELLDSHDRHNSMMRQILHPFGMQRVAQPGETAPKD